MINSNATISSLPHKQPMIQIVILIIIKMENLDAVKSSAK